MNRIHQYHIVSLYQNFDHPSRLQLGRTWFQHVGARGRVTQEELRDWTSHSWQKLTGKFCWDSIEDSIRTGRIGIRHFGVLYFDCYYIWQWADLPTYTTDPSGRIVASWVHALRWIIYERLWLWLQADMTWIPSSCGYWFLWCCFSPCALVRKFCWEQRFLKKTMTSNSSLQVPFRAVIL